MDQVREVPRDIGDMLASKQLKAKAGQSKIVILRPPKLRTEILTSLETDPVMMGKHKLGGSKSKNTSDK